MSAKVGDGLLAPLCRSMRSGAPIRESPPKVYENVIGSVCIWILFMEMAERLSFYGLTGSLKTFLFLNLDYSNFQASALANIFPAFVYLTPLLGGYLADAHWGRYKTIFIFGMIYIVGTALMTYSSYPGNVMKWLFMLSLYGLISLGAGGIKPNVVSMGADQFLKGNPSHMNQQKIFFDYFYWAINIGAAIAYGYLAQMATNGSGDISADYGFFWSFFICAIALTFAIMSFLLNGGKYILAPPQGDSLTKFVRIFGRTLKHHYKPVIILVGVIFSLIGYAVSVVAAFVSDSYVNDILAILGCILSFVGIFMIAAMCIDVSWVDSAISKLKRKATPIPSVTTKTSQQTIKGRSMSLPTQASVSKHEKRDTPENEKNQANTTENFGEGERKLRTNHEKKGGGNDVVVCIEKQSSSKKKAEKDPSEKELSPEEEEAVAVHDAKEMWRVMPIILAATSFWVAYGQMSSNFISMSCQMDLRVNGSNQLNASVLNIADSIAIIICIPIFDRFLYPLIERVKGSPYTPLQKIATGFIVACLAVLAAGFIEKQRRSARVMYEGEISNCSEFHMSDISVFWMVIPFALIGIAEVLIAVQIYDICYSEVPTAMKSTAQALQLFTTGLANAIAAGLTVAFQADIPDNLNYGHLEYDFFTIAAIEFVTYLLFIYAVKDFKYKKRNVETREVEIQAFEVKIDKVSRPGELPEGAINTGNGQNKVSA
eukprot:CAMPEP_0167761064 /NCGR_PEP_ID=MMETSP0110_2-20121227/11947_1 /TAXON_ID=629695 /ORGANISM="Gymnochlora sp., Strain CCMP2014" /LENGTH=712 /DNA_ID=CAMNT_0007647671 /DNA_START=122 /DNA_END=2260 /DNA_ORIENTATION=-